MSAVSDRPCTATTCPHPPARWLRARIVALRATTRRRAFPGAVEVVSLDARAGDHPLATWVYGGDPGDHALRVDVLARLLTDCRVHGLDAVALAHLRPGRHEPGDLDLAWASASVSAAGVTGVCVTGVVAVSRWGWHDLATGTERTWKRPRRS